MEIYSDASSDDNIAGLGWVIVLDSGEEISANTFLQGEYTSMQAEYFGVLYALRHAKKESTSHVDIYVDCEPLIEKMRVPDGKSEDWYKRRRGCHRLLNKFDSWELVWIPRSCNSDADRLAYEALEEGRNSIEQ